MPTSTVFAGRLFHSLIVLVEERLWSVAGSAVSGRSWLLCDVIGIGWAGDGRTC